MGRPQKHPEYYQWLVFAVVAAATFMSTMTSSIVNVALPSIMQDLTTDLPTVQWVISAYLLVIVSLLPLAGRIGDIWGRRTVYGFGFIGFTAGSLLCGLAPSIAALITARLIQAVGAAALMANGPAILIQIFPAQDRGKILGLSGLVVALGTMTGPGLGGLLTGSFGWHSVFLSICLWGFWATPVAG